MDSVPLSLFDGVGVVTVVLLVGWMVWTGRLVPRRTHEDALHDRDEWRAAHRISEAARVEMSGHFESLLEHARVTEAVLRALPHPDDERSRR